MKNILSYFRKHPIKGGILFAFTLGFLWISIPVVMHYTKVRDPADPRFDISKFSFEGYGRNQLAYFMSTAFPPGTPKDFVENVLVDTGKAEAFQREGKKQEIRYLYRSRSLASKLHPWAKNVGVLYDENNKVIETYVGPTHTDIFLRQ